MVPLTANVFPFRTRRPKTIFPESPDRPESSPKFADSVLVGAGEAVILVDRDNIAQNKRIPLLGRKARRRV